jgi:hypothetical protein
MESPELTLKMNSWDSSEAFSDARGIGLRKSDPTALTPCSPPRFFR